MFLSKLERVFILNLKGRISKVLNSSSKLKKEEKENLEYVFNAIDNLILYRGNREEIARTDFQKVLQCAAPVLSKTEKKYVKEHILPLINKISTDKWDK